MALINKISAVAEAVRERSGYTGGMTLEEMALEIKSIPYPVVEEIEITENGTYTPPEGVDGFSSVTVATTGSVEVEPIVLSGDCNYACTGVLAGTFIDLFGNIISTKDITNASNMFFKNPVETIPFDIKCKSGSQVDLQQLFYSCDNLITLPRVLNATPKTLQSIFGYSSYLKEIPEDFDSTWDWSSFHSSTTGSSNIFYRCYSLRKIPINFLKNCYSLSTSSYGSCYYNMFSGCNILDEIVGVPVSPATLSSNLFNSTFDDCYRVKTLTFETNEDGTPKTANWKSQTIDLSRYVGYVGGSYEVYKITNYGITADKQVSSDAKYQALKNDPDWFTVGTNYCRYNHDSAVNTINSLPDCSATGTNTIKFRGAAGAKTDGGAINTLTEEEIAVATAKGWTVSLV